MAIRIYMAGPDVFSRDPLLVARGHQAVLIRHGLEGIFPLDNDVSITGTPQEKAQKIFELNCRLIDSCDGVVADMTPFRGPSLDVGTAWEIGYAYAQGKPIVGYTEDLTYYRDKVFRSGFSATDEAERDATDYEVEHYELTDNLMITQCILAAVPTIEEAAVLLAERLAR